jgi:hypothetical protein
MILSIWISSAALSHKSPWSMETRSLVNFLFSSQTTVIEPGSLLVLTLPSLMYYTRHVLQLPYDASDSRQATASYRFTSQPQLLGLSFAVISIFCDKSDQVRMLIADP